MWRYVTITAVLLSALLAACSRQDDKGGSEDANAGSGHVWEEQVQTMDKARQLEQDLMDVQKRRDEALRKQEY